MHAWQERSQDFLEEGAKPISRAAPKFCPEATPLNYDVTLTSLFSWVWPDVLEEASLAKNKNCL